MIDALEIRPVEAHEVALVHLSVHETWGRGAPIADFIDARLASPQHGRARLWAAFHEGALVSSLGCSPVDFVVDGRLAPGFGFGAVHTPSPWRGRGLASALCARVARAECDAGRSLGLLFSDVSPEFYARLGWRVVDDGWWACDALDALARDASARLTPLDVSARAAWLPALGALYERASARSSVYVARDGSHWDYLLERWSEDVHLAWWVSGALSGYARLASDEGSSEWELLEAFSSESDGLARVWVGAARHALRAGATRLESWCEPPPAARALFERARRPGPVTMMYGVEGISGRISVHATEHF